MSYRPSAKPRTKWSYSGACAHEWVCTDTKVIDLALTPRPVLFWYRCLTPKKKIPAKYLSWIEARKRFQLSDTRIGGKNGAIAVDIFSLKNKIAFVTGAGSGIGQRIVLGLAEAGADVGCLDRIDNEGLAETVRLSQPLP